ncbi:MAG TPA: deoxynucleoside kinase [Edaphocola sp.]|nr:deoxynucleoside kinase [Edaphocola sp.]
MGSKYIVIEGNIGAGKTTLATKLSKYFNAQLILETFSENPYLSKFYNQHKAYALNTELWFFMERLEQLKAIAFSENFIISDYSFEKSNVFSGITLSADDLDLFSKITSNINEQISKPDLFIYLQTPIVQLKKNIQKRARTYEQGISDNYLEQIQNAYQSLLILQENLLIIEMDKVDFENENHFQQVISFLNNNKICSRNTLKIF